MWSSNNTVELTWATVNDPLVTHYRVCRDKRNDGQGATCSNETDLDYTRTLADGIYDFDVTAVAGDGRTSDTATVGNIRLDATSPTSQFNPLPVRVQAPAATPTPTNLAAPTKTATSTNTPHPPAPTSWPPHTATPVPFHLPVEGWRLDDVVLEMDSPPLYLPETGASSLSN